MTEGTPENPHYTDDPYPMRGYIFDRNGKHDGGDIIENKRQLHSWMRFILPTPAKKGLEVMITDNLDYCSVHIKNGELLFPKEEHLRRELGL